MCECSFVHSASNLGSEEAQLGQNVALLLPPPPHLLPFTLCSLWSIIVKLSYSFARHYAGEIYCECLLHTFYRIVGNQRFLAEQAVHLFLQSTNSTWEIQKMLEDHEGDQQQPSYPDSTVKPAVLHYSTSDAWVSRKSPTSKRQHVTLNYCGNSWQREVSGCV